MMKLDPIIAVKDVKASSRWYQQVFGLKSKHGGSEFEILVTEEEEEVVLCLHPWGTHEHPTLTDTKIPAGNGLILYFRTDRMHSVFESMQKLGARIEEEIRVNPNTRYKEFSVRDPDGYYLTVSEYHKYEG